MIRATYTVGRAVVVAASSYLGVLTVAAVLARHRKTFGSSARRTRFVVLIPAHNEELLLPSTLASIAAVDYPANLVDVHVVADNCTDRTAALAREAGATVHERMDLARPGKGPALSWLLADLRRRDALGDAVVFLDADTTPDPRFFDMVEHCLDRGAVVVQGHYAVRDPDSGTLVAFRAAAMAARTFLRPLGRMAIGGSAGLHGNGMVFRPDVLAERAWSDHLTEDVELHLDLLLDGTRVTFAPDARVDAEMPTTLEASRTQHERWERGRLEIARRYVPRLLRQIAVDGPAGRVAAADAVFDQLVPPFSVLAAGTAVWGALTTTRALVVPGIAPRRELAVVGAVVAVQGAHVLAALRLVGAPASVYRALLAAPQLVVWKLTLWLRVLVRPSGVAWTRTRRN